MSLLSTPEIGILVCKVNHCDKQHEESLLTKLPVFADPHQFQPNICNSFLIDFKKKAFSEYCENFEISLTPLLDMPHIYLHVPFLCHADRGINPAQHCKYALVQWWCVIVVL